MVYWRNPAAFLWTVPWAGLQAPLPGKQVLCLELQHSPALDTPSVKTAHLGFVPQKLLVLSCYTTAAAEQSCPCSARTESTKEGSPASPHGSKKSWTGISFTWTQHAKCSALRTILPKQVGAEVWSIPWLILLLFSPDFSSVLSKLSSWCVTFI